MLKNDLSKASVIDQFRTPRLYAKRLNEENRADFLKIEYSPEVMNFLGGLSDAKGVQAKLEKNLRHWSEYGFGVWLFYDQSGQFVGRGGIKHIQVDGSEHLEVGYALMPDFWRQGLATEMTVSFIEAARVLRIKELIALVEPTNVGSAAVVTKAGFRPSHSVVHADLDHVLYNLSIL